MLGNHMHLVHGAGLGTILSTGIITESAREGGISLHISAYLCRVLVSCVYYGEMSWHVLGYVICSESMKAGC